MIDTIMENEFKITISLSHIQAVFAHFRLDATFDTSGSSAYARLLAM